MKQGGSGNSNFFANAKKNQDEVKGWSHDFDNTGDGNDVQKASN
jgi:hypothetical protein